MLVVNHAPGLLNGEGGNAGSLHQGGQLLLGGGVAGRVAHDDDRTLGVAEEVRGLLYERGVALGAAHVAVLAGQVGRQFFLRYGFVLDVDGQGQVHRAGAPGHGGAKGGGDKLGDAAAVVNQPGALGNGSSHANLVHFLEGGHALFRQFGAAGHENDGAFRGVDGGKAGDSVGKARAAGEQGHGRLAGDAGVAVGHVHGGALVASVDEFNPLVGRGVHQGQDGIADDGKHPLDAFLLQAADEKVTSVQVGHIQLLSRPAWVGRGW